MNQFAVAAGDAKVAEIAAETLKSGGNAVDAAVAGALAACVAEPVLASFLGGGFLLVREPSGKSRLLDFFVQTPKRRTPVGDLDFRAIEADFGDAKQVFHIGAGAIATPGVPVGLELAHQSLGRTPFRDIVAPAASLAKTGAPLSDFQARTLEIVAPIFSATRDTLATFGDGERLLKAGDIYRNERLADVLETYAAEGARFCQEGEVAASLLSLSGGGLSADDLKGYNAEWRKPLTLTRGETRISLNPPPSLGGALVGFALSLLPRGGDMPSMAETLAATSRARVETRLNADPIGGAHWLLSPEMIRRYRNEVAGRRASTTGTTHISVIDSEGMGAALTLSNGAGGGVIAPGLGIMPNNMLGEEDLAVGDFHEWTPDTRLSSMMAPMAIEWPDGALAMLGSGGSNRIRSALTQVAARLVDGSSRLEDAIVAPRLHTEGGHALDVEGGVSEADREALAAAWPEARFWSGQSMFFGGVHAVRREAKGGAEAMGDPRREGYGLIGRKG